MLDVAVERGLTAVRDIAIAITEAEVARDRADAVHAARLRVVARADLVAGSTMVRILLEVRLAAVGGLTVAVGT